MRDHCSSLSVVVGIDGSRSAVDAALWAVDEAVVVISRCGRAQGINALAGPPATRRCTTRIVHC
jgi:hypothetical protein